MSKLAVCLVVFVIFQGICGVIAATTVDERIKHYSNLIDESISKVRQVFTETHKKATVTANNLRTTATTVEENVVKDLKLIFADFEKEFDKIKPSHLSLNAHHCLAVPEQWKHQVSNVLVRSSSCLTEKLDEASSYMDNMHFIYDNVVKQSKVLKKNFEKCSKKDTILENLICIQNYAQEINSINAGTLIGQIETMSRKLEESVSQAKKCYMKKSMDDMRKKMLVVLQEQRKCMIESNTKAV